MSTSSAARNSTSGESSETFVPPTGTGKCGVVPSPRPSGISKFFSQVACDNSFDKHVDDFFTYLRDVANLNGALSKWAPDTGNTSNNIPQAGITTVITRGGIEKRSFGHFLSVVVKVFKFILDVVIAVSKAVATAILTFKIDGVERLTEPDFTAWCVDCGIRGSIYTTRSANFTIIGPTQLSLRLRGDLNANVQLGVDGFAKWEHDVLSISLTPDLGLPGFSIPGVLTIGPYLSVDNGLSYWTPLGGHKNADMGMQAEGTKGELRFLYLLTVQRLCEGPSEEIQRSHKLRDHKWFLEGPDANSAWYKADIPFGKEISPKTSANPGNLAIGLGEALMIVHPDLVIFHDNNTLQARQVPAIAESNALPSIAAGSSIPAIAKFQAVPVMSAGKAMPTIAVANATPTLQSTQAVPVIGAVNAAPTLDPNLEAPSFDYVPGGNLAGDMYTLGAAVSTATTVFIVENKYRFLTFEDIIKSATVGVAGAVPTAKSSEQFTGWTTLTNLDIRQKSNLAVAEHGNFYMVGNTGGTSSGTQFYSEDSIGFKDQSERMFHYYPDTM
ncbi:hypothetical protein KCV07_g10111, partial [Aureobasidium melanogenum]